MQEGWKRRRDMEAAIGREALRRAGERERRSTSDDDRLQRVGALARQATEDSLDELSRIIETSEDEVHYAARLAFRLATRRILSRSTAERGDAPGTHDDPGKPESTGEVSDRSP